MRQLTFSENFPVPASLESSVPFEKREPVFTRVVQVIDENLEKMSRAIAEHWRMTRN